MLHNYLITALRNFTRHKLYSFINIAGLTVGLTCAIFIILFVRDQLSYDRWIPDTKNLYRVESTFSLPGQLPRPTSKIPYTIPQAMLEQIPEVKARTRLIRNSVTVSVGNRQFSEMMDSVDPNFFQIVKLPLVVGQAASVFAEANSVVLSQTVARKYFGDIPALGKTITLSARYCDDQGQNCQSRQTPLTVTGILRDLPHNTQIAADLVMPNISKADPTGHDAIVNPLHVEGWGYVLFRDGADPDSVLAKLKTIVDHQIDPAQMMNLHVRGSEVLIPRLTPFLDDHLSSDRYGGMVPGGSWTTVYGFMTIGALILLVACFNFTNLATARATMRAREISLRKVMGAARRQLVVQFLGESLLTAMIALVLALALSEILLPLFDHFLGASISFSYLKNWPLLLMILGIGIAAGLLSGVYPALVLSGFRPATNLRGGTGGLSRSGLLRTSLVVLQFAVSIGLGIAVLVMFLQVSFARHIDLGFKKDDVLVVDGKTLSLSARDAFIQALRTDPNIVSVATSDNPAIPFLRSLNETDINVPGDPTTHVFRVMSAGPDYADVYTVKLLAGRLLSREHGADAITEIHQTATRDWSPPYNAVINDLAARSLGFSAENAVGKTINVDGTRVTIVGVIDNIKMEGAAQAAAPTLYRYLPNFDWQISVRIKGDRLAEATAFIDRTWRAFAPSTVINRHFLNDDYERQFLSDERQGDIFGLFVGIAIFIACLGLFGLAAFSTERRTKEIGIRKAFGARARDIVMLLLWQFSIPVLVANLIAWPVAYYYLRGWLEGYAYRIALSPLYFLAAGGTALLIAWGTVIVHAAHVARANPIHALRYE